MTVTDFEFICQILRERSGLVLTNDKAYLLESRLLPVARKWKLATFDDLVRVIRTKMDEAVVRDVVEAMTTNESFFFRDTKPFDQFKALVLPALLKSRAASRTIRIWSAACSSGQEPYSLAMILSESAAQLNGWKIEIVGTDLSTEILNRAKEGMYSQFEVQRGLPITMLVKYFAQIGDRWQINAKIRGMVQYQEFNLLHGPDGARPVRRGVLPQRADLLRPADQDPRAQQRLQADAGGRRSSFWAAPRPCSASPTSSRWCPASAASTASRPPAPAARASRCPASRSQPPPARRGNRVTASQNEIAGRKPGDCVLVGWRRSA